MALSKPEILQKADAIARENGSKLSFRRFCPDLNLPAENKAIDEEGGVALDQDREHRYYTWLVTTGIFRALVEAPDWVDCYIKGAKKLAKKITKTRGQLKKDMADANDAIREVFLTHIE